MIKKGFWPNEKPTLEWDIQKLNNMIQDLGNEIIKLELEKDLLKRVLQDKLIERRNKKDV